MGLFTFLTQVQVELVGQEGELAHGHHPLGQTLMSGVVGRSLGIQVLAEGLGGLLKSDDVHTVLRFLAN